MPNQITKIEVDELLYYNSDTGLFYWKVRRNRFPAWTVAGTTNSSGYIIIMIDKKVYRAHRLAFLTMTGKHPAKFIDHKDGNRSNNKWSNLREANNSNNLANSKVGGKIPYKGVYKPTKDNKYVAQIGFESKHIYLGRFDTAEEAALAYDKKAKEYFGEFARLNFP